MKIGFGTYATPRVPLAQVLPHVAQMGYESVELCVASQYEAAPNKLGSAERAALRGQVQDLGLELSGLMVFVNLLAEDPEELGRQEDLFRRVCLLAQDLAIDPASRVIASTIGHGPQTWEQDADEILRRVARFAEIADQESCRFALEPHVGGILSDPERSAWVIEQARLRNAAAAHALGLNFDISHFTVGGYPLEETIARLAPYSWHTHVKDGRMEDGKVRFLLPGEGDTDYVAYFRAMAAAGWTGAVTVEVSAQIFNREDYDPWAAAQFCLDHLRRARAEVGVPSAG